MTWEIRNPVDLDDDYRDPQVVDKVVTRALDQTRYSGVLVYGVSRIGKTSLLHRLRERAETPFGGVPAIDLRIPRTSIFSRIRGASAGLLLDEAQELRKWAPPDLRALSEAIGERPFVMAAWPSLKVCNWSDELRLLLDRTYEFDLPPLSRAEAFALIRKQKTTTVSCSDALAEAIFGATGGHPNLIARLCNYHLSDHTSPRPFGEPELEEFITELEDDTLHPVNLIYDSLPPRAQQVIEDYRRGGMARLGSLRKYGITTGHPAAFVGTVFGRMWSKAAPLPPRPATVESTPLPVAPAVPPVFSWLHLSDLHFGVESSSHRFNRDAVLKALLRDVEQLHRAHGWSPDRILITGDIAFSGQKPEYEDAAPWIRELATRAGTPIDNVRLVPGNHDVDRKISDGPGSAAAHRAIRAEPVQLDRFLALERQTLSARLIEYESFVKSLNPGHPNADDSVLDWHEPISLPHTTLHLVGISTVWVSDKADAERKLVIGEQQLQFLNQVEPEHLLMLLTHHPPGWLHHHSEQLLLHRMGERAPHVHLCGHVHNASAHALRQLGVSRESMRVVAGAGHGDTNETHGYAWGALRFNPHAERWELGWAPRVFVNGQGMRPNSTRFDLDDFGFAWEPLRLDWRAPSPSDTP